MTFNATAPTQNYTYDQENRLTGAAGYAYTYDADGNRVRKSSSSTGTLYWYMTPGIVGESDLSGNLTDEYVFFDGERVARKSTNGVFYYFSDHLKTASVITDAAGNIKSESDFYPWGGELQFVANDSNHYKFTGKERDPESGLDYFGARYYSNGMGRWVSADWSAGPATVPYAHLDNPQTLNLYSYVDNNPINGIDADGHAINHEFDGLMAGLDAGPPANEGGPTQTQAALQLAAMSSSAFGWQLEAQQAQLQNDNSPTSSSTTGQDQSHYASVSYWPTGAGGFGHIGIGVDTDDTQGFSTKNPNLHWWQRLFGAPQARTEDDIVQHTKNGDVAPHTYTHIPISAHQAQAMQTAMANRTANAGHYNLLFNNCAGFVESVLHAGRVSGVPHAEIFGPPVLYGILAYENSFR
jgi:RHS repeat-associated protein